MITKKIIGIVLQMPIYLLIFGSLFASIYASIKNIQGITWGTPIILGVIIIFYFIGKKLYNGGKNGK